MPGVIVAAASGDDGKRYWETRLAAPLAGSPLIDSASQRILALSALGALFDAPADLLATSAVLDQPTAKVAVAQPLSAEARQVRISADRTILATVGVSTEGKQATLLLVDGADAKEPLRWLPLSDQPTAPPVGFRGGLLVPGMVGQILVVDARTGRNLIEPFQPRLEASRQLTWREPAVVGDSGVVVTDGSTLYCLAVDEKPAPHLAAAAQATLTSPIVSPLAALDRTVYAVDDRKQIVSFNLPDLAPGKSWPVNSAAAWGPRLVGDVVLVVSQDQICCLDGGQNLRWQVGLEHGPVVGTPLRRRGDRPGHERGHALPPGRGYGQRAG